MFLVSALSAWTGITPVYVCKYLGVQMLFKKKNLQMVMLPYKSNSAEKIIIDAGLEEHLKQIN